MDRSKILDKIEHSKKQLTKNEILNIVDPILKSHFRPEFLNRLDEVLPFLPLRKEDMHKIVDIQMHQVLNALEQRHIPLKWTEALISFLSEEGYDANFGARPLKRLIQQDVLKSPCKWHS